MRRPPTLPKRKKPEPSRQVPLDLRREPAKPKTDSPAEDKSKIVDGVLQPLPAAD